MGLASHYNALAFVCPRTSVFTIRMEPRSFPADNEATDTGGQESLTEADHLPTDIDPDTLRKYFTLTESDLAQIHQCRGVVNKLGFAVLLCTLRWHGSFLRSLQDLPQPVLETVATQVGVLPIPLDGYPQHENTRYEHCERIRQYLQFVRCDATQRDRLFDHLVAMAQGRPRATALRHVAEGWLQRERIVRPGGRRYAMPLLPLGKLHSNKSIPCCLRP